MGLCYATRQNRHGAVFQIHIVKWSTQAKSQVGDDIPIPRLILMQANLASSELALS